MTKKDYLTVEELNFYISNVFLEEDLLHNVPVVGEVSGCSLVGGHCYFTLKDEKSQIKVCFFNIGDNYRPHNGEQAFVIGKVDYYAKGGTVSLKAYSIVPFGSGALHAKLEELKQKLELEGLFREEHKKEIPSRPNNVCVITSAQGAALQDFITTVRKKNEIINITVIDVRVQGENAVSDIVTALNNADDYGYDVLVLCRGGGSFEDLYTFNEEAIARTVYGVKTPIISAIGHDTDYTLCDFVSDKRCITPTAAAELVGYDVKLLINEILDQINTLSELVNDAYFDQKYKVENYAKAIKNSANNMYIKQYSRVLGQTKILEMLLKHNYEVKKAFLESLVSKLDALSPTKLLNLGYFRILKDKSILDSIDNLEQNDIITIFGKDGKATAKILNKEINNEIRG